VLMPADDSVEVGSTDPDALTGAEGSVYVTTMFGAEDPAHVEPKLVPTMRTESPPAVSRVLVD
jgi:hypothetical protein